MVVRSCTTPMSGLHPAQSVATSTDKADVFSEAKNFSPRMPERRRLQQFFLGHSRLLGPSATFTPTRTMRRQGTVRTLGVRDTRGRQRTSMAASPDSSLGHWAPRLSFPRGAGHWGREHSSRRTDSQAVRVVRNSGRTCSYLQPNLPHVFPGSREGGARITHSSLLTQRCVCSLPLGLLHVRDNKFMKCLHCCDALSVTESAQDVDESHAHLTLSPAICAALFRPINRA